MKTNMNCLLAWRAFAVVVVASLVSATMHAVNINYAAIARKTRTSNAAIDSEHTRAPRPEAPNMPAIVSPFDTTLLADIAACCCNLTNIVLACCSLTSGLIGSLGDPGICDASRWSTVAGIQGTQQSVIGWLKTIMIELRGLCQPMP